MRPLVLVTGLPGSGKTTVARQLAGLLRLPLLCTDEIKETVWDALTPSRPADQRGDEWRRVLGHAARQVAYRLLADAVPGAVMDDNLLADSRAEAREALHRAGPAEVHEVWCALPVEQARTRFETRRRDHPVHRVVPEEDWGRWAPLAQPLGLGHVHRLDTTRPVDVAALSARISSGARG